MMINDVLTRESLSTKCLAASFLIVVYSLEAFCFNQIEFLHDLNKFTSSNI